MRLLAVCILLATVTSCRQQPAPAPVQGETPATSSGAALERAALESGAIRSGGTVDPTGQFQGDHGSGGENLCLSRAGQGYRFALSLSYDDARSCAGEGVVRRAGETLIFAFDPAPNGSRCTLVADYDGDRIAFPGRVDAGCEQICTGRGSIVGIGFDRTDEACGNGSD